MSHYSSNQKPQNVKSHLQALRLTSRGALCICTGVQGEGSELCSSARGRGGVAVKMGVAGVSDWSALVGVAQGDP